MIALLDGDIIGYLAAALSQRTEGWDEADEATSFDPVDVHRIARELADEWTQKACCTDYRLFVTGPGNFRYLVDPTYKGNRKGAKRPIALDCAKAFLREELGGIQVDGLEADDLLGLSITGSYADKGVAVSADKDLATVPGRHFNPNKDQFVREVSEVDANRFWMLQTLMGDATDGYGGAKGIGPKKAEKAIHGLGGMSNLWEAVRTTYRSVGMTDTDAIKTARLARILRRGDYDKSTREVLLWHPKTPIRAPLASPLCKPPSAQPSAPDPSSSSPGSSTETSAPAS